MIEVQDIVKSYKAEDVLKGVSFVLEAEKNLSVLGASGSGKSTLLKIIAGLIDEFSGSILINGKKINHLRPQERGVVYMYQQVLLFPHLNVEENIGFGLRIQKKEKGIVRAETDRMIEELHLRGQEKKYPHQLSGGQQQRVSFGRAFIIRPEVLLLDEPFAGLDPPTRRDMQHLFREVAKKEKITSLFVTHDVKEALITGDEFGLMKDGRLRLFENKTSFINDAESGVRDELNFWKSIES